MGCGGRAGPRDGAATAPATRYEARRLLHAVGRLALCADQQGLPWESGVWRRTETINAFVLYGCTGLDGSTVQTYRAWLRRTGEALVWVQRGEAPPVRISSPRRPQPPYERSELAGLRAWADHLPGRARRDGLALMALGAGCGLTPGEVVAVRGRDIDTRCGVPVLDDTFVGRLVACRASWVPVLTELAEASGDGFLFRPGRKVEAAKNLVSSWPARHRPPNALLGLSARRLRSTWIVTLLAEGINPAVVADAAGMTQADKRWHVLALGSPDQDRHEPEPSSLPSHSRGGNGHRISWDPEASGQQGVDPRTGDILPTCGSRNELHRG